MGWLWETKQGWLLRISVRKTERGIYYKEKFAPLVSSKAIRIALAISMAKGFELYQMDVKSVFLNGFIEAEVYMRQPPSFENPKYSNRVYKL
jgi:hypothetical protein